MSVPTPAEPPRAPRRTAWIRLGIQLAVFALGALLVVALARSMPPPERTSFAHRLIGRLKELRPHYVLVGNSMVETRFDSDELNRLLAPERATVLGVGGSKSAYWYLLLKNVVLRTAKPKRILLFYRRQELAGAPELIFGTGAHGLDEISLEDEPLLDAKRAPPRSDLVAWLGLELDRLAPFERLHALAEPTVSTLTRTLSGASDRKTNRKQKRALDSIFGVGNLRASDIEAAPARNNPANETFEEVVAASFLPDIIALTRKAGVPLTCIRVRTRAAADSPTHEPSPYQQELDAYLRAEGVEVVDMSGAEWEEASLYGEGDHIAQKYRKKYTRLFVEHRRYVFH